LIDLFTDFACPFCYLAEVVALRAMPADRTLRHRAFELRPAPARLTSPAADPFKRDGWSQVVAPVAAELGITMRLPSLGVRTRKAHEAAIHARKHDRERAMRAALYAAYFEDGRDIGRIDVLVDIAASVGMDRTDMKVTLDIDQHTAAVEADAEEAAALGLRAVPAFVMASPSPAGSSHGHGGLSNGPRILTGLQDEETLANWMGLQ
jgi:predicted DsbA family dithiol-disulfide isomerase